ncbi:MAG TPA: hypothetical protein VE075_05070, partial [Thermoanaerobaculia bacterium]|nr:hypothetical protein [Thermoanaerobaculia bacterium]
MRGLLSRYQLKALAIAAGVLTGLLLTTTGCYVGVRGGAVGAEFEVDAPPPVVHEEVVLARPGPDFV